MALTTIWDVPVYGTNDGTPHRSLYSWISAKNNKIQISVDPKLSPANTTGWNVQWESSTQPMQERFTAKPANPTSYQWGWALPDISLTPDAYFISIARKYTDGGYDCTEVLFYGDVTVEAGLPTISSVSNSVSSLLAASISFTGTDTDSGIQKLEAYLQRVSDNAIFAATEQTWETPWGSTDIWGAATNASITTARSASWTLTATETGVYSVVCKATDSAGNVQTHTVAQKIRLVKQKRAVPGYNTKRATPKINVQRRPFSL